MQNISTCLWFDNQAEEAAAFYVGIFPNSCIVAKKHYLEGGPGKAGDVMTVQFMLNGSEYVALNGGPLFKFSPAISLVANCDTQAEVDRLWSRLLEGGQASQCGWLTDRFGLGWQVNYAGLSGLMTGGKSQQVMEAMMTMTRIDIQKLEDAAR